MVTTTSRLLVSCSTIMVPAYLAAVILYTENTNIYRQRTKLFSGFDTFEISKNNKCMVYSLEKKLF